MTLVGLSGLLLVWFVPALPDLIPPCLFRQLTGYPCPACGATHSAILIAHFKPVQAFLFNPFFTLVYLGVLLWGLNSLAGLLFKKSIQFEVSAQENRVLRWVLILSFPLNWFYLLLIQYFIGRNG